MLPSEESQGICYISSVGEAAKANLVLCFLWAMVAAFFGFLIVASIYLTFCVHLEAYL